MVVSRKPKPKAPARHREALSQKFERVMAESPDLPFPNLTKREAIYFLRRLAGSDPNAPSSRDVMREFWGEMPEDEDSPG